MNAVNIFVVLDRSGSMSTIAQDAIGGFNTFIKAQQEIEGEANVTLAIFDDRYDIVFENVPVDKVVPLTSKDYIPRGWTALLDAVGYSLSTLEELSPEKAILCVITDGEENQSREYTHAMIKEKVQAAEARGWQVVFLAANINEQVVGASMGIAKGMTRGFVADSFGTQEMYLQASAAVTNYRSQ